MKKSRFNLCCIVLGIFAAMLLLVVPSVVMATAGGLEGLGDICNDTPDEYPYIIYDKAGGPVYLGTVTVSYSDSNVYINGSVSQGNKCTAAFITALYLKGVDENEWDFFKDAHGHNMKGLRLGIDTSVTQTPEGCANINNLPQCFEIIAVGNFSLINDNIFSGMFVLMPLE